MINMLINTACLGTCIRRAHGALDLTVSVTRGNRKGAEQLQPAAGKNTE